MHMLTWLVWCADVIALITALAMLKDTFIDRTAARQMLATLKDAFERLRTTGQRPDMAALQPALRFFIRTFLLVLVSASAGVCVVYPQATTWHGMILRAALALFMASNVPCPWFRWITRGDARSKANDPPGVERRSEDGHVH